MLPYSTEAVFPGRKNPFYTTDLSTPWQSSDMWQGIVPNGDWFGNIPTQTAGSIVYYYIEAVAANGKTITRPITAPDGWWKFCVTQSSNTLNPLAELEEIYPNPASAITVVPVQSSSKSFGSIVVFNSLGQFVQEIFKGEIPSGNTNYFLDAGKLASGTYFENCKTAGN